MDGVEGKLKVWIRRVWTLEMVSFYFCILSSMSLGRNRADTVPECHRLAVRIRAHKKQRRVLIIKSTGKASVHRDRQGIPICECT